MSAGRKRFFSARDYLVLGLSVALAFTVWLVHNLSLNYSDVVQCTLSVRSGIDRHDNKCVDPTTLSVRCEMRGFDLMRNKRGRKVTINVAPEDLHSSGGDLFYMTASDVNKYFHDIFPGNAKLEYVVTDTLFFEFPAVDYRKIPVHAVYSVSCRSQYMALGGLTLKPDSVFVYGRKNLLDRLERVNTEMIALEDLDIDVNGEAGLEKIAGVRYSADKVRYSQTVVRYVEQDVQVPVVGINVPQGVDFRIFPGTATVKLRLYYPGGDDLSALRVTVDYADYASSRSGRCIGTLEGLEPTMIYHRLSPEVFDCLVQSL